MSTQPDAAAAPHASIWRFAGDPDDLLPRYDAMCAEIEATNFVFHACLRGPDGIVIVDTCPSREAFDAFVSSDWLTDLIERCGLPTPEIVGYPLHTALANGTRVSL